MTQKQKSIGLFAILPLLSLTLLFGFSGDAYATNVGTVDDGAGDKRFGSGTKNSMPEAFIEKKTTPVEAKVAVNGPYFDLVDVQPASANTHNLFKAIFDVWAGDINVENVALLVKSDTEAIQTIAGSFNAGDHSITTVTIRANDPASISANIVSFQQND